jgi:hypothetical protein
MALPCWQLLHRDASLGYGQSTLCQACQSDSPTGFPFSFGVLQDYYSTHPPLSQTATGLSAVGTTCSVGIHLKLAERHSDVDWSGIDVSWRATCFSCFPKVACTLATRHGHWTPNRRTGRLSIQLCYQGLAPRPHSRDPVRCRRQLALLSDICVY